MIYLYKSYQPFHFDDLYDDLYKDKEGKIYVVMSLEKEELGSLIQQI